MTIRHALSGHVSVTVKPSGDVRTKQSMAAACDINGIMARYLRTGAVDHFAKYEGTYGFATSQTFHDAMNVVRRAEEMFEDLSAEVRTRFGNDPAAFLTFCSDEKNVEEMRKLGLAKAAVPPAAKPEPLEVRVVGDQARDELGRFEAGKRPGTVAT